MAHSIIEISQAWTNDKTVEIDSELNEDQLLFCHSQPLAIDDYSISKCDRYYIVRYSNDVQNVFEYKDGEYTPINNRSLN